MVKLTKEQRKALKRLFDRYPLYLYDGRPVEGSRYKGHPRCTYRQFRRKIVPGLGMDCIMVPYCGMWVGIERDGYTHS